MRKMEHRSSKTAAITAEKSKADLCHPSRWGVREKKKKKLVIFSSALPLKRHHKDPRSFKPHDIRSANTRLKPGQPLTTRFNLSILC